ncbi:MAG: HDIG domain-containing metalloprotein, partial [Fibrobacterota bacterium]
YTFFPDLLMESIEAGTSSLEFFFNGVPMLVAILLASILFNRETGLILTVFFAAYMGITTQFSFISTIKILITGGIAAHIAHSVRYRKDYLHMVLLLTLANTLVVGLSLNYRGEINPQMFLFAALFSLSDALFSVVIAILILPVIESRFSITTNMKLLELADMSHPLMKRLSIEAPGTYNHSILVANLAESASDKIGANSLLCRVASYYHDIGKIEGDSNYFVENQRNGDNPHDRLSPDKSVSIILQHVENGVKLAKKYQLPDIIISAIREHHGDVIMQYFYNKARESTKNPKSIDTSIYRYAGPKPQSAETAILLLADSVEAASRTFKGKKLANLKQLVEKVIYAKIELGLLDESTLTFDEVDKIKAGFLHVLEGLFHNRIEYE